MPSSKRPLLIAVTGGIGSGKSTFCRLISNYDYPVFSADVIAHNAYSNPDIIQNLTVLFGEAVLVDGTPNRKLIGKLVFDNSELRRKLNSILHPHILLEMQR
ncbi:MAG: dephospho-CoA kinase, partial [Candidatus Cloacimonetes bacterium]|nr:dephospho-CoA kinase [Candidatus Cloacimonadota bacterium]